MSHHVLARDDFARVLFYDDFFALNPAFAPLQEQVTNCKSAYQRSAAQSQCSCGGDSSLLFDCMDATLAAMEAFRTENPAALQTLVAYINDKQADKKITSFTLYYRKDSTTPLVKLTFP